MSQTEANSDTTSKAQANPDSEAQLVQVWEELQAFRRGFRTLLMATHGQDGEPDASYAAYVDWEGDFLVFVSELSAHTRNLRETGRASVLFIEDEGAAAHLFARRRLTFRCEVAEIPRDSPLAVEMLGRFETEFGALIQTLKGLDDFHLLRLRPLRARYVAGFARAFEIEDVEVARIRHIRDKGHRRRGSQ